MILAVVASQIEIRSVTSIGDHPFKKKCPRGLHKLILSQFVCDGVVFLSKVLLQPHILIDVHSSQCKLYGSAVEV